LSVAKPKQSLAELCNIWISEKVKAKFDYSSATARQLDIQNFMKAHKSQIAPEQFKTKTIRDSFMPQLKKVFDKFDLDPKTIGLTGKKKLKYNAGLNATVTPDPQVGKVDSSPDKPKQLQTGVPDPNNPDQTLVVPEVFDEKAVSAVFSALFLTFRMAVPDMELLTDEEKETLGKIWKPAFNIYFSNEKWAVIGIPTLATLGIAMPKILAGRKKGKIRKSKEEGLEKQKEIDTKVDNQAKEIEKQKNSKTEIINAPEPQTQTFEKPQIGIVSSTIIPDPNKTLPVLPKPEEKKDESS